MLIEFVERVIGESKMSGNIVQEAMLNVAFKWSVTTGWTPARARLVGPGLGGRRAAWHRL